MGMPGADTPFTAELASSLFTTFAGTCPSMTWPVESTTPVWHEASSIGTPSFCLIEAMSAVLMAVTSKPDSRMCSTQPSQQPQFGSWYTVTAVPAAYANDDASNTVAPVSHDFMQFRSEEHTSDLQSIMSIYYTVYSM